MIPCESTISENQQEVPEGFRFAEDVTRGDVVSSGTFTRSAIVSNPPDRSSDKFADTGSDFCGFDGAELMSRAVNVLALVRDGQRYVFLYDDSSVETVLAKLAEFAGDSELDFTWYDAAMMSQRVRHLQAEEQEAETEDFPTFF